MSSAPHSTQNCVVFDNIGEFETTIQGFQINVIFREISNLQYYGLFYAIF
jgi:hypothetical protein